MATMMRHPRPAQSPLWPASLLSAALLPAALLLLSAATPAIAQPAGIGMMQNQDSLSRREPPKPSGLPGARRSSVAPAERSPSEMSPNEALFDAVNRGDVAAARDAITRGAQVDGRNMLGLTPLELSIDIGRNELTFLLLSMRGTASAPPPPTAAASTAARAVAPAATPRAASRPAPAQAAAPAPVRQRQATAAAPVPEAGFLGFGTPPR
jgi:hypothetical protein